MKFHSLATSEGIGSIPGTFRGTKSALPRSASLLKLRHPERPAADAARGHEAKRPVL
jgi:hypothetical protein